MLSKNNHSEQIKKQMPKQQHFAIKKLTVGVASVLVGLSFMGITQSVHADAEGSVQQTPTTEKQAPATNGNNGNQVTFKTSAAASQASGADQVKSAAQSVATSSAASSAANQSLASNVDSSAASSATDKKAASSAASDAETSATANPFVVLATDPNSTAAKKDDDLANYAGMHFVFEDANGNPLDGKSLTNGQDYDKYIHEGFTDKSNWYTGYDSAKTDGQKTWDVVNGDFSILGYKLVNWKDVVNQMVPGSKDGTPAFKMGTTVVLKYAPYANTEVEAVDQLTGKVIKGHTYTLYTNGYRDASLTYLYTHKADATNWGYATIQPYAPNIINYTCISHPTAFNMNLDDDYPVQTISADGTVNPNTKLVKFFYRSNDSYKYTLHYVNALTNKPLNVKSKITYGGWSAYMPDNSTIQLNFANSGTTEFSVFNEIVNLRGYKLVNYKEVMNQLSYDPSKGGLPMAKLPVNITLKYAPLAPIEVVYKDSSNGKTIWTGVYSADDLVDTSIQYRLGNRTAAAAPRYVINPLKLNGYKLASGEGEVVGYIDDSYPTSTLTNQNAKKIVFTYDPVGDTDSGVDENGHAYGQNHQMWTYYTELTKPNADGSTRLPGSFTNNASPYRTYAQNGSDPDGNFQKQLALITPMGWNYNGTTGFTKNDDYANDMIKTWIYYTPNQPVFVNYYDTEGNKLADTVTLASNKNNPNQSNDGINGMYVPYGNWTAPQREFHGYTLVKTEGATSGQFNSFTYNVNYIYAADTTGKVTYYDDTDNTILRTDDLDGVTGQAIDYTTADKVKEFEGRGLKLKHNGFTDGHETFNKDATKNNFEVHFEHATSPKTESQVVTETIHYVYSDGSQAAPDAVRTVNFSRDNTVDQHNGQVTDGTWTPDSQTFAAVVSPTIANYTPDKAEVAAVTVNPGAKDFDVTVIYNRDAATGAVTYIDDTTNQHLSVDNLSGQVGQAIDYTTAGKVADYESQGLTLVSNNFTDGHETYNKGVKKNNFEVHFQHTIVPAASDTKTVKETIHYVYEDGSEARPDFHGAVTFSHGNTYDKFTKHTTNGNWTPANGSFDDVKSPTIKGYKPSVESVAGYTVTPNSEDQIYTVIYSQQATKGEVNYVDLTANRVLATVPLNGNIGDPIDYTTAGKIADYEKQGLVLYHNDFKDGQENFAKNENQNFFEVQFKHKFQTSQENKTVKEIIHYVYADGKKAADDYNSQLNFSRTKTTDLYTGDTNFTRYSAWDPEMGQFKAVDSPVIANFTANMLTVPAMAEFPGNPDYETTVVYTRNAAQGMVTYYDDTTGIQLRQDSLNGKAGLAIDYTTADKIAQFKADGYDFVSNNFTDGHENFNQDATKNNFEVHFKHGQSTVKAYKNVKETIHYQYADGTKAADDATADVTFNQSNTIDSVDGSILKEGAWTPANHEFAAVKSPAIKGYTPDYAQIAARNVTPASNDYEITVTYIQNTAAGRVTYFDDTTNQTLRTDALNGHSGEAIDYTTAGKIKGFEAQGLTFVSNNFKDGHETFADNVAGNTFEVHFKHNTTTTTEPQTVKETIHYVYADGTKAANDHTATVNFTRTKTHDAYTGNDTESAWTPANGQFVAVASPTIVNYTPDKVQVAAIAVNPGDKDTDITVTYNRDAATGMVTYIDDTTKQNLAVDSLNGNAGDVIDYTTAGKIANFEKAGLTFVSNNFKDGHENFDKDAAKNTFEVHFKHTLKNVNEAKTVNETIHYQYADGTKAADDHTAKVSFSRTNTVDQYTGQITKTGAWTPANGQFATVVSPTIKGYTPDLARVASRTVDPTSADLDLTVTYVANPKPVNPSQPSEPSTPVNPSQPSEPSTPVNPSQPSEPSTPVNPSQPSEPSTPVNPSQPSEPSTPVNPSQPSKPSKPVNPSQPSEPSTPVNPSQPSEPSIPVNPSQPSEPSTPVNPSQPSEPSTPVNPSQPSEPSTPVNPSQPSEPSTPVNPSQPSEPSTPVNPSQPSEPSTPVNPSQPSKPINPSQPSEPSTPSTPNQPSSQGTTTPNSSSTPVQPSTPAQPSQPTNPSTPNRPSSEGSTTPNVPDQPSQPSEPSTPVNPSQPAQPSTPNQPSSEELTSPNTPNEPAQPSQQNKPAASAQPAQSAEPAQTAAVKTPAANKPSASSATEKLPQTGNDQAKDAAMAGLGLAAILGFFGLGKRRRND